MNDDQADEIREFLRVLGVREKRPGAPGRTRQIQRRQFRRLIRAEAAFVRQLREMDLLGWAYESFIHFIREKARNTLAARPYFRERHTAFMEPLLAGDHVLRLPISQILKEGRAHDLDMCHLNARFAILVVQQRRWSRMTEKGLQRYGWWRPEAGEHTGRRSPEERQLFKIFRRLLVAREAILEANLRLAVNRARIFWRSTPTSHLSPADFIQIASEGMLAAVDKVVLTVADPVTGIPVPWDGQSRAKFLTEPGSVYCSVAIGRSVGGLVEAYSATTVHFYPNDKKILYRANREQFRHLASGGLDYVTLAKRLNDQFTDVKVDPDELAAIMLAAGAPGSAGLPLVSGEGDDEVDLLERHSDGGDPPDTVYEDAQRQNEIAAVKRKAAELPLLHQKLLALRGLSLN